ncbi:hypothetical protein V8F33_012493 [Rhypophila sp. PSN 637]
MPLARKLETKWFCCNCGDGPWSPFIVSCQNSLSVCKHQHHRCNGCLVEVHGVPTGESWERSERGSYTFSGIEALRDNGSTEPYLQHPNFPGETDAHFALQVLAEPHGSGYLSAQASWTTEPHTGSTNTYTPAIPLYEFQASDRLTGLEPLHPDFPKPTCQASTTFAWDLFDPCPTTFPVPADHSLESVWPTDPLSFPSESWLSTLDPSHTSPPQSSPPELNPSLSVAQSQSNSFATTATTGHLQTFHVTFPSTGQPQPSNQPSPEHTSVPSPDQLTLNSFKYSQERSLLACPFWKKDPHHAWSASPGQTCCTGHKRIRDVKQHIYRHHTHQAQTSSRKSKREKFERLTEHQILQLRQYSKRNSGEKAQWFAIWDILFPSLKLSRPASPYVKDLEAELDDYRVSCLGRDVKSGIMPLSPISPSPIPLVKDSPDTDTAVWESEALFKVDDDAFFQQYGVFGSRFEYLDTRSNSTALDGPCLDEDTTGFWDSHSGPVQ